MYSLTNKNILHVLDLTLPTLLFFGFDALLKVFTLDNYVGPSHEAAYVAQLFLGFILSFLLVGIFNTQIQNLYKSNHLLGKLIFYILNFPASFLFPALLILCLGASNLNPIVRSPIYKLILLELSSFLALFLQQIIKPGNERNVQEIVWN